MRAITPLAFECGADDCDDERQSRVERADEAGRQGRTIDRL
jgi:hypothetical protein